MQRSLLISPGIEGGRFKVLLALCGVGVVGFL